MLEGFTVYTDLAVEANDLAVQKHGQKLPGIEEEIRHLDDVVINRIKIKTAQTAAQLGKEPGDYITVHSENLRGNNREEQNRLAGIIAAELKSLIGWNDEDLAEEPTVFVVGLGNWRATPDALGPKVLSKLLVTRHLYQEAPPELRRGIRPVCGLTPGVLGLTGIETGEIIRGIIDRLAPDLLIVVDALSARGTDRLGATVQMSNTGIAPGSGVGGNRLMIDEKSMEVPVIAIGVPTVVHGLILANETLGELQRQARSIKGIGGIPDDLKRRVIEKVLKPFSHNAIMTPKGIDELIEEVSRTIAGAINIALHHDITEDNLSLYLH